MMNELSILSPNRIYPENSGGYIRSFNFAKIASSVFNNVNLISVDEYIKYDSRTDSVHLIQDSKYGGPLDKPVYFFKGAFSSSFGLKTSNKYLHDNNSMIQIEDPLFYHTLKKNNVSNYIINEHNVNWELYNFPPGSLNERMYRFLTSNRNKKIEKQALSEARHIFVCSERDKALLSEEMPIKDKITVIPNCLDYEEYRDYSSRNKRTLNQSNIIFIGTYRYYPNVDAVNHICEKIAPRTNEGIIFRIIGKNPPKILAPKNVLFTGYIEDIKMEIMNSDICIAPIRYGSGTRYKILEYMAMGKTVVSTSKGAEGIDYSNNVNIIIEDDINKFPVIIEELIADEKRLREIGMNARSLISTKYDWQIYKPTLTSIYKKMAGAI